MYVDIECVFDQHLDGSEVKPGEEPRAKREWLEAIQKESRFAIVEELPLSPNNNYEFRIRANDKYTISLLLRKWYFNNSPSEADGYLSEFLVID